MQHTLPANRQQVIAFGFCRAFYGDDESITRIAQVLAARRLGDPQEVADVLWFVVSDLARWVTGTAIEVHGGGEGPSYLLASTGDVTGTRRD